MSTNKAFPAESRSAFCCDEATAFRVAQEGKRAERYNDKEAPPKPKPELPLGK